MEDGAEISLDAAQRAEVAAWIGANKSAFPPAVATFLEYHERYLVSGDGLRSKFDSSCRELRRALGITPKSEARRSGRPVGALKPAGKRSASTKRSRLEQELLRCERLGYWHGDLTNRHQEKVKKLREQLAKMPVEADDTAEAPMATTDPASSDDPNAEQSSHADDKKAASQAYVNEFKARLELGDGPEDALEPSRHTLMSGDVVTCCEETATVPAELPKGISEDKVIRTLKDTRVRYDFSMQVTRIELEVEKKIYTNDKGAKQVASGSTAKYGPPGFSVTWNSIATLAIMVAQMALPFNRLAAMLSTGTKRFTAASLSKQFHYFASRFVHIYLALPDDLANSEIMAGDDTNSRVLEVTRHFAKKGKKQRPWWFYRNEKAAQQYLDSHSEEKREKLSRPSLAALIGAELAFESQRRDGTGPKQSLNTTVVTGRGIADVPQSLIVFYRSHFGSFGNLLELLLKKRRKSLKEIVVQGDLSASNAIRCKKLLSRFAVKMVGCTAHARRPFALYEDEDADACDLILHLFKGLALHEEMLDFHGRNRENVTAIRNLNCRPVWEEIKDEAQAMVTKWSKSTKLGTAARYIVNHYDKLVAYLDDPRIDATNNLREQLLRTEKLIQANAMFRNALEGRFALDIARTIIQTSVAAEIPVQKYLVDILRTDPKLIERNPERYTPYAWSKRQ